MQGKLQDRLGVGEPGTAYAKRVRFRDARESQWERVAEESAGGIIPRD
jgi:hypothetical protein